MVVDATWVELKTEDGRTYFWNRLENSRAWVLPEGVSVKWVGQKSPDGRTYYWSRDTKETVWVLPPLDDGKEKETDKPADDKGTSAPKLEAGQAALPHTAEAPAAATIAAAAAEEKANAAKDEKQATEKAAADAAAAAAATAEAIKEKEEPPLLCSFPEMEPSGPGGDNASSVAARHVIKASGIDSWFHRDSTGEWEEVVRFWPPPDDLLVKAPKLRRPKPNSYGIRDIVLRCQRHEEMVKGFLAAQFGNLQKFSRSKYPTPKASDWCFWTQEGDQIIIDAEAPVSPMPKTGTPSKDGAANLKNLVRRSPPEGESWRMLRPNLRVSYSMVFKAKRLRRLEKALKKENKAILQDLLDDIGSDFVPPKLSLLALKLLAPAAKQPPLAKGPPPLADVGTAPFVKGGGGMPQPPAGLVGTQLTTMPGMPPLPGVGITQPGPAGAQPTAPQPGQLFLSGTAGPSQGQSSQLGIGLPGPGPCGGHQNIGMMPQAASALVGDQQSFAKAAPHFAGNDQANFAKASGTLGKLLPAGFPGGEVSSGSSPGLAEAPRLPEAAPPQCKSSSFAKSGAVPMTKPAPSGMLVPSAMLGQGGFGDGTGGVGNAAPGQSGVPINKGGASLLPPVGISFAKASMMLGAEAKSASFQLPPAVGVAPSAPGGAGSCGGPGLGIAPLPAMSSIGTAPAPTAGCGGLATPTATAVPGSFLSPAAAPAGATTSNGGVAAGDADGSGQPLFMPKQPPPKTGHSAAGPGALLSPPPAQASAVAPGPKQLPHKTGQPLSVPLPVSASGNVSPSDNTAKVSGTLPSVMLGVSPSGLPKGTGIPPDVQTSEQGVPLKGLPKESGTPLFVPPGTAVSGGMPSISPAIGMPQGSVSPPPKVQPPGMAASIGGTSATMPGMSPSPSTMPSAGGQPGVSPGGMLTASVAPQDVPSSSTPPPSAMPTDSMKAPSVTPAWGDMPTTMPGMQSPPMPGNVPAFKAPFPGTTHSAGQSDSVSFTGASIGLPPTKAPLPVPQPPAWKAPPPGGAALGSAPPGAAATAPGQTPPTKAPPPPSGAPNLPAAPLPSPLGVPKLPAAHVVSPEPATAGQQTDAPKPLDSQNVPTSTPNAAPVATPFPAKAIQAVANSTADRPQDPLLAAAAAFASPAKASAELGAVEEAPWASRKRRRAGRGPGEEATSAAPPPPSSCGSAAAPAPVASGAPTAAVPTPVAAPPALGTPAAAMTLPAATSAAPADTQPLTASTPVPQPQQNASPANPMRGAADHAAADRVAAAAERFAAAVVSTTPAAPQKEPVADPRSQKKVTVSNIPAPTKAAELADFFTGAVFSATGHMLAAQWQSGEASKVVVGVDLLPGSGATAAEITFGTTMGATVAVALHGIQFKGKALEIRRPKGFAQDKSKGRAKLQGISIKELIAGSTVDTSAAATSTQGTTGSDDLGGATSGAAPSGDGTGAPTSKTVQLSGIPSSMNSKSVFDLLQQFGGPLQTLNLAQKDNSEHLGHGTAEYVDGASALEAVSFSPLLGFIEVKLSTAATEQAVDKQPIPAAKRQRRSRFDPTPEDETDSGLGPFEAALQQRSAGSSKPPQDALDLGPFEAVLPPAKRHSPEVPKNTDDLGPFEQVLSNIRPATHKGPAPSEDFGPFEAVLPPAKSAPAAANAVEDFGPFNEIVGKLPSTQPKKEQAPLDDLGPFADVFR